MVTTAAARVRLELPSAAAETSENPFSEIENDGRRDDTCTKVGDCFALLLLKIKKKGESSWLVRDSAKWPFSTLVPTSTQRSGRLNFNFLHLHKVASACARTLQVLLLQRNDVRCKPDTRTHTLRHTHLLTRWANNGKRWATNTINIFVENTIHYFDAMCEQQRKLGEWTGSQQ
jgi:hypothetical protein